MTFPVMESGIGLPKSMHLGRLDPVMRSLEPEW